MQLRHSALYEGSSGPDHTAWPALVWHQLPELPALLLCADTGGSGKPLQQCTAAASIHPHQAMP